MTPDDQMTPAERAAARTPEQREEWKEGFMAFLDGKPRDPAGSLNWLEGWDDGRSTRV